jgi:FixJ family two-component response regulator
MNSSDTSAVPLQSAVTRHAAPPLVFVLDDDVSVRESLKPLLLSAGWAVETFECAHDFLACDRPATPGCLILDLRLPHVSGLEVQARLASLGAAATLPIIFITGFGDVPTSVRAMKAGAVEFLTKPLDDDAVLAAVQEAVEGSRVALAEVRETKAVSERYASLSAREREVLELVVRGLMNKQVGAELGISEITVKAHRGRMMRKMQARSLPDLVVMNARLSIVGSSSRTAQ